MGALRHELDRALSKLEVAEDLVREQEEEMQRLRDDRYALLRRLEDTLRRHHQQQRPGSPEISRVREASCVCGERSGWWWWW